MLISTSFTKLGLWTLNGFSGAAQDNVQTTMCLDAPTFKRLSQQCRQEPFKIQMMAREFRLLVESYSAGRWSPTCR